MLSSFILQKLSEQSAGNAAIEDSEGGLPLKKDPGHRLLMDPKSCAAKLNERKHLHNFIEEFFKRSKAARSCVAPKVFDVDCSCITDVRETDMIMDIFAALQCVYMKAHDEEQKQHPGRPTMAASLELIQEVLELNIQNSKTFGLKTYQPSEMEPIFEEIKNYFNIDVNFAAPDESSELRWTARLRRFERVSFV